MDQVRRTLRLRVPDPSQQEMIGVFQQMNAPSDAECWRKRRHICGRPWFNFLVSSMILVNALQIGIEMDYSRGETEQDQILFFALDCLFGVFWLVEMLLRINQHHWDYLSDSWNILDYAIVCMNCTDIVSSASPSAQRMKLSSAIRCVRLLRIVRGIRGIKMFYGLWMLIQGFLDSLRTMFWVTVMLIIIFYVMAVALTDFAGTSPNVQEHWENADKYVGTVYRSMWTIIQICTFDAWAMDIARPLASISPLSVAVVIGAIVICAFGLLNVIVAVMVEHMQANGRESVEKTSKVLARAENDLLASMAEDFRAADQDGSGELGHEEFTKLLATTLNYKLRLLGIHTDEAESLFECMDADKSGTISPEEFLTGVQKVKGLAKGQDMVQLIHFAQQQCVRAAKSIERLKYLSKRADTIQLRFDHMGRGMSHELRDRNKASDRKDTVFRQAKEREIVIKKLHVKQKKFVYVQRDRNGNRVEPVRELS